MLVARPSLPLPQGGVPSELISGWSRWKSSLAGGTGRSYTLGAAGSCTWELRPWPGVPLLATGKLPPAPSPNRRRGGAFEAQHGPMKTDVRG